MIIPSTTTNWELVLAQALLQDEMIRDEEVGSTLWQRGSVTFLRMFCNSKEGECVVFTRLYSLWLNCTLDFSMIQSPLRNEWAVFYRDGFWHTTPVVAHLPMKYDFSAGNEVKERTWLRMSADTSGDRNRMLSTSSLEIDVHVVHDESFGLRYRLWREDLQSNIRKNKHRRVTFTLPPPLYDSCCSEHGAK